jgi:hypothetical protein
VSRDRGIRLQNALARYLASNGWPLAESAPSGHRGSDIIKGTPGIVWENKTAGEWRVLAWVRQAKAHAWKDVDVPVTVYWPVGVGESHPEAVLTIVPLPVLVGLLRAAGYGSELPELAALRDPAVMAAAAEAKTGDRSALRRRPAPGHESEV